MEAYDLDQGNPSSLTNVSTRGFVREGDNVMIGGFISATNGSKVVVRALGPTLAQFNVPNILQDPTLSLYDANGIQVAANDDWKQTQQAEIVTTGLAPLNDAESAILITRPSGNTTAIVRGKNGATGVAPVEV